MRTLRATSVCLVAAAAIGSGVLVSPARADRDDWHHDWHHHRWYHQWVPPVVVVAPRPFYSAAPPLAYYAPPPVYAPPPPVVYAPPPAYYAPGTTFGFTVR